MNTLRRLLLLTAAAGLTACGGGQAFNATAKQFQAMLRPAAVTVTAGQSVSFSLAISGNSVPPFIWTGTGGTISADANATQNQFTAGTTPGDYQVTVQPTASGDAPLATATVTVTAGTAPTPVPTPVPTPTPSAPAPARLFPSAAADWLYTAPTGASLDISSATQNLTFELNTHDQGFDYPVVSTDGTHGCTNFTDTLQYAYTDHYCVPNPPNGYWPSVGGWGANDGHLVVVDTSSGYYYDFWKLYVNSSGQPTSTNVGGIARGSLSGNGTPGHTASTISGLAGTILPGELDCATCLNHALSIVVPGGMNSNLVGTQAPAVKTDGSVHGAIFREGAKIRFDPSIDVSKLNASVAVKAILRALQLYGGVITDQTGGSKVGIYTGLAHAPDTTGMNLIGAHLRLYY
ncbi:MAG TPA: hypothetical protein VIE13_09665 [Terriglobales bacterium]